LRDGAGKAIIAIPPIARPAVEGAQATTDNAPTSTEEKRNTARIFDGVAHDDNPPETHFLQFLVREFLADEAGDFRIRLFELPPFSFSANLASDAVVVIEERALNDGNLGGDTLGGFEVLVAENAFGVTLHIIILAFKAGNPPFPSRAIAGDREVDYAVLLTPGFGWFGDADFSTKESRDSFFSTELVLHCFNVSKSNV